MLAGLGLITKGSQVGEGWSLPVSSSAYDFGISPANAKCGFVFNTDGTIDDFNNGSVSFLANFSNLAPSPLADLWIRLTSDTGDYPNDTALADGSWYQVVGGSFRSFYWEETANGYATTAGIVIVDLCTVGDGSNIVATGSFQGSANVEP